jgi:hypothetical protein
VFAYGRCFEASLILCDCSLVCIEFEYTHVFSWSVVERRLLDAALEIFVYEALELLAFMLYSAFSVYPRAPASDAISPAGGAVKH